MGTLFSRQITATISGRDVIIRGLRSDLPACTALKSGCFYAGRNGCLHSMALQGNERLLRCAARKTHLRRCDVRAGSP